MRAPDRFEYTVTVRDHREAMMAGTKFLMRGSNTLIWGVMGIFLTVLVAMGGAAIATLICQWRGVDATWWILVGWLAAGGFFIAHQNILYFVMARKSAASAIHNGVQMVAFDESGVTYGSGDLHWFSPWGIIDSVARTKNTVAVIIGGMSFAVPKSAIGDNDAVTTLVADLEAQISDA